MKQLEVLERMVNKVSEFKRKILVEVMDVMADVNTAIFMDNEREDTK